MGVGVGLVLGFAVGATVGLAVGAGVGVGVAVDETQFQVMPEGDVMANVTTEVVPEVGTLPVPDQPLQVYPDDGDET